MRRRTRTGETVHSGVQIQHPGSGIVVCIDSYHGRRIRFRKAAADNVRIGGIGSACIPQRLPPIDKRDRPDYLAWDLSSHLSSALDVIISNSGLQIKQIPFKPRSHEIPGRRPVAKAKIKVQKVKLRKGFALAVFILDI